MFAKVFYQILDSSLANDYQVRHVFEDFLKLCDPQGVVDMTHDSISRRTNVPLEIVRAAVAELEKPDPLSRSKECEGRRIVRLDDHREWGWRIVNFRKYWESSSKEMLRMGEAQRKREYRERIRTRKGVRGSEKPKSVPSSPSPPSPSEGEGEREQSTDLSGTVHGQIPIPDKLNTEEFLPTWTEWIEWRRRKKACKNFEELFARQLEWLSQFPVLESVDIIKTSMRNDWQGLFPLKKGATNGPAKPHDRNANTANETWGSEYNSAAALKSQQKTQQLPGL